MLSHSGLPTSYWSYALSTTCHIINRLPTPLLNQKTPWETLFHKPLALSHLRTFGCTCFPLLTPYHSNKLQPKTKSCIFLGYPTFSKGNLCLDQSTNRLYTSRNVLFNESQFSTAHTFSHTSSDSPSNTSATNNWLLSLLPHHDCSHNSESLYSTSAPIPASASISASPLPFGPSHTTQDITLTVSHPLHNPEPHSNSNSITNTNPNLTDHPIPDTDPVSALTTPAVIPDTSESCVSATAPPDASLTSTHSMTTGAKSGIFKPKVCYMTQPNYSVTEPPSYKTAAQYSSWCNAMQEEYDALQRQGTWSLVPPPTTKNIVGCKWVYKLKHNSDGSISKYKARLVVKGFH